MIERRNVFVFQNASSKFDGDIRFISNYDIANLRAAVASIDGAFSEAYNDNSSRNNPVRTSDLHQDVQHLFLVRENRRIADSTYRDIKIARFNDEIYNLLENDIDAIVNIVSDYFNKNELVIARLLLTKLLPYGEIPEHVDTGYVLTKGHRIHLPIITNESVAFSVGETTTNLLPNGIYEINNGLPHKVLNNSDQHRVHLIMDLIDRDLLVNRTRFKSE